MLRILLGLLLAVHAICLIPASRSSAADDSSPEFLSKVKSLLRDRCSDCHNADDAQGAVNIFQVEDLIKQRFIDRTNPYHSKLLDLITTNDEAKRMPKDQQPLPPEEIDIVRKWLGLGAPELPSDVAIPDGHLTEPAFAKTIGIEYVLKSILQHQRSLRPGDQPYFRYFSSNHLLTRGASQNELAIQRDALVKTLHHLTYERDPVPVTAIDGAANTVFAVDIRKLGWSKVIQTPQSKNDSSDKSPREYREGLNAYDLILLEYPYGISYNDSETFDRLKTEFIGPAKMVRAIPYLRIDWFVSTALQPLLYHDIMQMPHTVQELERRVIGVDTSDAFANQTVIRGAVSVSGVSKNNRAADRFASTQGYYWKSIDSASSKGRENIFRDPIHLEGVGGEMIFSLPNGMQGYYLSTFVGDRLDAGPTDIVTDKFANDKVVRNALSCVRCHDRGIKRFKDVVRPAVEQLPGALGFSKREVLELYPDNDTLSKRLSEDEDRFMNALEKILGHAQSEEPVIPVSDRFLAQPISLSAAAGELGLTDVADLKSVFRSRKFAALGLVPLASHGTIRRDAWEDFYDQVVVELGLGTPVVSIDALSRLEYAPQGLNTDISITTTRGNRVFAVGDEIQIIVKNKGNRDLFIELVGTGTEGEKIILLPSTTKLAARSELRFPEKGKLTIKPQLGSEQVTLFSSEKPFRGGVLYRGEFTADRLVHDVTASEVLTKQTLIMETR